MKTVFFQKNVETKRNYSLKSKKALKVDALLTSVRNDSVWGDKKDGF